MQAHACRHAVVLVGLNWAARIVCAGMCAGMCIDMCLDVCSDMCLDMCRAMCRDMCIDVRGSLARLASVECLCVRACV